MNLLTRQETARKLRIGIRTLDRRLASGELKCYRLGDGLRAPVRISEEQIDIYLRDSQSGNCQIQQDATRILNR